MIKVPFNSVFTINSDGSLEARSVIRIGGVTLTPGIKIPKGSPLGGIDLSQFSTHDLEITPDEGVSVITGIY